MCAFVQRHLSSWRHSDITFPQATLLVAFHVQGYQGVHICFSPVCSGKVNPSGRPSHPFLIPAVPGYTSQWTLSPVFPVVDQSLTTVSSPSSLLHPRLGSYLSDMFSTYTASRKASVYTPGLEGFLWHAGNFSKSLLWVPSSV